MKLKSILITVLLILVQSLNAQYGEGRYTFVFLNTNPDRAELPKEQVDSLQAGHMANINRLVKEKKMISAGPFYTGGGIFLFDTNLEDTQAILDSDPAIAAGRFKLEVYSFDPMEGKICTLWHMDEAADCRRQGNEIGRQRQEHGCVAQIVARIVGPFVRQTGLREPGFDIGKWQACRLIQRALNNFVGDRKPA